MNKAIREFSFDDGFDKFAERLGIEFVARSLSLELPFITIRIEDAISKKVE